jgi:hypothetical protein
MSSTFRFNAKDAHPQLPCRIHLDCCICKVKDNPVHMNNDEVEKLFNEQTPKRFLPSLSLS